jgi:hypothetical protein
VIVAALGGLLLLLPCIRSMTRKLQRSTTLHVVIYCCCLALLALVLVGHALGGTQLLSQWLLLEEHGSGPASRAQAHCETTSSRTT